MSHVTYEWVMSHINESCRAPQSYELICTGRSHIKEIWKKEKENSQKSDPHLYVWNNSFMSDIIEKCHIWMSHVTHEWVISHIYRSGKNSQKSDPHMYVWNNSFISHIIEKCHMWISHITHEWVISHIYRSGKNCPKGDPHKYVWDDSFISDTIEKCHTWMSHVTSHMNESFHTYIDRAKTLKSQIHIDSNVETLAGRKGRAQFSHITRKWVIHHISQESDPHIYCM